MDLWALWGKTMSKGDEKITHPLLCHMIDVAAVTGALWDVALGAGLRQHLAAALGCDDTGARQTLMFWAALHDLGKASPAFQRRYEPAMARLQAEGLAFRHEFGGDAGAWHGLLSAWALPPLLEAHHTPRRLARDLARTLGGHHGSWPPPGYDQVINRDHTGDAAWDAARADLVAALAELYAPVNLDGRLIARSERQALVTLVGGLVSAADWLGSMTDHFPALPGAHGLAAYAARATSHAQEALHAEQWDRWQPAATPSTFRGLFPDCDQPYAAQQAVIDLADELKGPGLVLIEAPTGSGKTESALYLADHWAHTLGQRGLYVAMPTTATSNQMHCRVARMLDARYGPVVISPLLIHGQARWQREPATIHQETAPDEGSDGVDAMSWFLPLKRGLLAPFGVGTVDQALLSVLLTRHFFVRLFGLAGKTVIFDEVHAYDTYMSTLFARLLGWLRAQNCTVVMLSATLPAATRAAFLKAYGATTIPTAPYPAVTWVCGDASGCLPLPASDSRVLALEWLPHGNEQLIAALRERLAHGGCAAVLCNTVARAQAVYQSLRDAEVVPAEDLTLFHARFPMAWRQDIERLVVSRYGKNSAREQRRGIVVATQVIEQSLDLDFDLMVSDLAPIDLLLQRAGRLHRHQRERPQALAEPRLLLVEPENVNDLPKWGNDAYVYEPYMLLRTFLLLRGRSSVSLPAETQALIEAVYGEAEPVAGASAELLAALDAARRDWEETQREHAQIARTRLVLSVDDEDLFQQRNPGYAEEDPSVHKTMRAMTRLGEQGILVVCLHEQDGQPTLEPEGGAPVEIGERPSAELTRELVLHSVQVTHRGLVSCLLTRRPPKAWRQHALLRHSRHLVFANGACTVQDGGGAYVVTLSRALGLIVTRERT